LVQGRKTAYPLPSDPHFFEIIKQVMPSSVHGLRIFEEKENR
jgi:hypothetical protein